MPCRHKQIQTWVFEDTQQPSGMWSCVDCGLKFEPIDQRKPMTDEEIDAIISNVLAATSPRVGYRDIARAIEQAHNIKK